MRDSDSCEVAMRLINVFVLALCGLAVVSTVISPTTAPPSNGPTAVSQGTGVSVERWICTDPPGTPKTWSCRGMQAVRITLKDGTVIGPVLITKAESKVDHSDNWVRLPANSTLAPAARLLVK